MTDKSPNDATSTHLDESADSQRFPYWRQNLRILPLANLLTSMGFALSFPFLPLMVRSLGVQENLET